MVPVKDSDPLLVITFLFLFFIQFSDLLELRIFIERRSTHHGRLQFLVWATFKQTHIQTAGLDWKFWSFFFWPLQQQIINTVTSLAGFCASSRWPDSPVYICSLQADLPPLLSTNFPRPDQWSSQCMLSLGTWLPSTSTLHCRRAVQTTTSAQCSAAEPVPSFSFGQACTKETS